MNRSCLIAIVALPAITSSVAFAQHGSVSENGRRLYDAHCAQCHGERLQNAGISFDLRTLNGNERDRFEISVLDGKGTQMPPWRGTLGTIEIEQLWAYIRENAQD
ncbi:c-type cytochrome [Bradyrhizobium canariense]|uniref:c-type cytochrome n=1 Tax=Bradyrhizobium canariense TaxID=255045 RepID=UPI001B8A1779|nr:cytochrome c [Bradyrhizobium canariense]MBR0955307.1 cytochrome c [Bradyrhizobium canariense]